MKKIFALIILSLFSVILLSACGEKKDGQYAQVTQCLTEKGVKMYGAFWCSHCANQKKMFGSDVKYITYIECDQRGQNAQPDACIEAGIVSYPTWTFPGQPNEVGEKSIEILARKANCQEFLPGNQEENTAQSGNISSPDATPVGTATNDPEEETTT
jgi:hypothetical protein